MKMNKVVLDADFFRKFTDDEFNTVVLETVLKELGYKPVMHSYVARRELRNNKYLDNLIKGGKIEIIADSDYLTDEDMDDYETYFRNAYFRANACNMPVDADVMTYGYDADVREESLGEIRSIYLARKKGYSIFLSDDNDSRRVVDYINSRKIHIDVFGVADTLFKCKEQGTELRFKDLKNVLYRLKKNGCKQADELFECFHDINDKTELFI